MYKKIINSALNLMFPPRCPSCDGVSDRGNTCMPCRACAKKFVPISGPVCALCGAPVSSDSVEYCGGCLKTPRYFDGGRSVFRYKEVASSVLRFKYNGRVEYGGFFAGQMYKSIGGDIAAWKPGALIPIPLSDKKFKARGYNQAQVLAAPLGESLKVPVISDLMSRNDTLSDQKKLNSKQRINNILGAFKITQNSVQLESVVLIDDVYTTGATLNEAAKCLKQHDIKKVYFAVLASGE